MRLLLDTNVFLRAFLFPDEVGAGARRAMEDRGNDLIFSVVGAWEIAIKFAKKKLRLPERPDRFVRAALAAGGVSILEMKIEHALRVSDLPRHHADPFDHLLIAQALVEDLTIVTADAQFRRYDVKVISAA